MYNIRGVPSLGINVDSTYLACLCFRMLRWAFKFVLWSCYFFKGVALTIDLLSRTVGLMHVSYAISSTAYLPKPITLRFS